MKKNLLLVAACLVATIASWAFAGSMADGDSPVDMTEKIVNPSFASGTEGWTLESDGKSNCAAVKAESVSGRRTMNVWQTVSGLPAGRYLLEANAFNRPDTNAKCWDAKKAGTKLTVKAYLFANSAEVTLPLITDERVTEKLDGTWSSHDDCYLPNNSSSAAAAFAAGLYPVSVNTIVSADGILTFGVKCQDANEESYTCFDNFRLTYLGAIETITDAEADALLATVPSGTMNRDVKAALDAAVEALKAEKSLANYDALAAAINAANESVWAYIRVEEAMQNFETWSDELSEEAKAIYGNAVKDVIEAYHNQTISGNGDKEVEIIQKALLEAIEHDKAQTPDRTYLIQNPNFDTKDTSGWSGNFGSGKVKATGTGNPVITSYGGTFDVYQTISGVKPGTYLLKVQAFSRPIGHDDVKSAYASGKSLDNEAYIYANKSSKLVKLITEEWSTKSGTGLKELASGKYIPDSSDGASTAFTAGLYDNELLFVVGEDGKMTIGIRNDLNTGTAYIGYDNFRLTYVSSDTTIPEKPLTIDDVLAILNGYKAVAEQVSDHAAFDAVLAGAQAKINAESTAEELEAARTEVMAALAQLIKSSETENGVLNLTALIQNPTFNKNTDGWETVNGRLKQTSSNNASFAQMTDVRDGETISQRLKGMPAGHYTLKVQGFYRPQGWKQGLYDYEHLQDQGGLDLFLNDTKTPIKSIFADGRALLQSANQSRVEDVCATIDGRGFPLMTTMVNGVLSPNHYWNILEVELKEDGDITLGVDLAAGAMADNWTVLDNFRLYYGTHKGYTFEKGKANKPTDPVVADATMNMEIKAGELTPVAFQFDIPAGTFDQMYAIGGFDDATQTAQLYPVTYVKAGTPAVVVAKEDISTLTVKNTYISSITADNMELPWQGGVITPIFSSCTWRISTPAGKTMTADKVKFEIQPLDDLHFNATIVNYQSAKFLAKSYTKSTNSFISDYNKAAPARRDIPHSIGIPANGATKVVFGIGSDMKDERTIEKRASDERCYIPNLIPGNTYYFKALDGSKVVSQGHFHVEGPLRQLYAPSVYNIRDLGGWKVADGRITRYGLIYRGGEVNGYHAPSKSDVNRLKELGIGAEIDLRYNDSYDQDRETNKSGFDFKHGETYYFAGANDYTAANLSESGTKTRLATEFRYMLNHISKGRGVYFHCVFGADRTGFFAFLIEGLLGMDLNAMYHDYELTSFAAPAGNRNKSSIQERISVIEGYAGATLRDKFENYWVNQCKITKEEVELFRNIMLTDADFHSPDLNQDGHIDTQDLLIQIEEDNEMPTEK